MTGRQEEPQDATGPARPAPLPPALRDLRRTAVMGICNVTPDSFSDGGLHMELGAALDHCLRMVQDGADLIDVGGESTRPGAGRVPATEELRRVIPLVKELSARAVPVSVDTMRASVAAAAHEAGAVIINDVSGGLADPAMLDVMAQTGAVCVLTHWRAHSDRMDRMDHYTDVVEEVATELAERAEAAVAAGVDPAAVVLDPGFGFAKAGASNWPLLARLDRLSALGFPILVGVSRKRFLQGVTGPGGDVPGAGPDTRDAATAAVTAASSLVGAWCVRVHAVAANAAAVRVAAAIRAAGVIPGLTPIGTLGPNALISGPGQGMMS
jgi:dihydropteroate synthase